MARPATPLPPNAWSSLVASLRFQGMQRQELVCANGAEKQRSRLYNCVHSCVELACLPARVTALVTAAKAKPADKAQPTGAQSSKGKAKFLK